jgi:dephospho-CoA kinase
MLLVGLTGGIGSGKSTVAAMLAERGAVVVDADDLARRAVETGTPGFDRVREAFGETVVGPDGSLDREALAALVFRDPDARRKLESIVHPEVARLFLEERQRHEGTHQVLVYAVPLLVENGLQGMFDVVVVVTADEATRVARLQRRGLEAQAARDRMAAQLTDAERERVADVLIRNDGSMEELVRRVDEVWADLTRRAAATG